MKALCFDYDGTLVDTETVEFESWRKVFDDHGEVLEVEDWIHVIGGAEVADFKVKLEARLGHAIVDWDEVHEGRLEHHRAMMSEKNLLPGVLPLILEGQKRGYKMGVASSSPTWWVEAGLERFDLLKYMGSVRSRDRCEKHKPHPEPYLKVLEDLGCKAELSFGFEDSDKGVASGKAAGLTMIAVPNDLTRYHDLSHADQVLDSLEQFSLPE